MKDKKDMTKRMELALLIASKLGSNSVSGSHIDDVVSKKELEEFNSEDVLQVSYKLGFRIDACRNGDRYRADGVWLKPTESIFLQMLRSYHNLNYTYCGCDGKPTQEIKYENAETSYRKLAANYVT
jgi:hypothetical protein